MAVEPVGHADPPSSTAARRYILGHWRYQPATEDGRPSRPQRRSPCASNSTDRRGWRSLASPFPILAPMSCLSPAVQPTSRFPRPRRLHAASQPRAGHRRRVGVLVDDHHRHPFPRRPEDQHRPAAAGHRGRALSGEPNRRDRSRPIRERTWRSRRRRRRSSSGSTSSSAKQFGIELTTASGWPRRCGSARMRAVEARPIPMSDV